jgi:hypothetical protein
MMDYKLHRLLYEALQGREITNDKFGAEWKEMGQNPVLKHSVEMLKTLTQIGGLSDEIQSSSIV